MKRRTLRRSSVLVARSLSRRTSVHGAKQARVFMASKRYYADGNEGLVLTLSAPHETLLDKVVVDNVNLTIADGDIGFGADHVPFISEVQPGTVEITYNSEEQGGVVTERYFASSGSIQYSPDNTCAINCGEVVPIDRLDIEAIQQNLEEWKRKEGAAVDIEASEIARIAIGVHEAMLASTKGF